MRRQNVKKVDYIEEISYQTLIKKKIMCNDN